MPETPEHSKSLTVEEAANVIAALPTFESVLAFVGDDERKGVVEAANRRGEDLASTAVSGDADAQGTRLGSPPGPEAKPGKPLEQGGSGKAVVRTRYPVDLFQHGVAGVPPITSAGVEVERSKVGDLIEAAQSAATYLEEVA